LTIFDNLGTPYAICEYKYNEFGDVLKELYFSGNNILFKEYSNIYTYDENKNWIKKINKLDKKFVKTEDNIKKKLGVQAITMRTISYF
jgi:hypothetical protein